MNPQVLAALSQVTHPQDVSTLLWRCKDLVRLSRNAMKYYYDMWDRNDAVYRGDKKIDESDKLALKRNEPSKFILPATFSQVQTFVSFCMSVYNQRDYFYELDGTGIEDCMAAKVAQATLEQNLEHNNFRYQKLRQLLTDVAKYGVGVVKHAWTRDVSYVYEQVPGTPMNDLFGQPVPGAPPQEQLVATTKYLGNWIRVISPYHFLPDPRVPLARYQEGEFMAVEDEYSGSQLRTFETQGLAIGVQYIPKLSYDVLEDRRKFSFQWNVNTPTLNINEKQFYIITEVQLLLNPAKTFVGGVPLDPERDFDCKYVIWIANDNRIIRIDKLDYPHDEFTYDVCQFEEDTDHLINLSMVELIAPLQDTMDWFINSRVTNVRKIIANQAVVDPAAIEMQDLKNRNSVLRLKPQYYGSGVEKYYKQIELKDVTTGHLNDVNFLYDFAKGATGLTENLLGQFATGRRSAQEARNVSSNAVQRVLFLANNIWSSCLLPLGRKMLANLREGLDEQQLVRIIGQSALMTNPLGIQEFKQVTKADLVGNYDFLVLDGTLPTQRQATAEALQELLQIMMSSPEAAFVFQYDPQALMTEILELRGIRNAERFKLSPDKAGQLIGLVQAARNAGGAGGAQGGQRPAPQNSPGQQPNGPVPGNAPGAVHR